MHPSGCRGTANELGEPHAPAWPTDPARDFGERRQLQQDAPRRASNAFFWKRNFPLEFLGSKGTCVMLVVSRAQWRHFRGPYEKGKHKKKAKQESKKNVEICMCDMLLRFKYTATRAQPDPLSYHLGPYRQSSGGIFKNIALFCIFFTLREAQFC